MMHKDSKMANKGDNVMKKYLMNLRKQVGHMPILVCGASVIIENEDGEILLQLRKDNKC